MIVDCHVHINPFWQANDDALAVLQRNPHFDAALEMAREPSLFLEYLDEQGVDRAVCINYVSPNVVGYNLEVNEFAAAYRDSAPDRLAAFGGVDVAAEPADVHRQLDRLIEDLDLDGVKLHPPHQDVAANAYREPPVGDGDRSLAVLYERCAEADLPVTIHTGTSVFPNARNVHADPLALDDVCTDFACDVVMAHGGRPLHYEEAEYLCRWYDSLYLDLSSIPPNSIVEHLPRIESFADRTMFGSDWPGPMVPDIGANVDAVRSLDLSPEATEAILGGTARRLFDW